MLPPGSSASARVLLEATQRGQRLREHAALRRARRPVPIAKDEELAATPVWQVDGGRGKAFVDFQNDVAVSDVKLAAREGFRVPEHLKRYTTLGMATDQGKTTGLSGSAVLANVTGRYIGAVGTTTFRPPLHPSRHLCLCRASPRPGFPPGAACAVASMGERAGRGLRRDWALAPRALLPDAPAKSRRTRSTARWPMSATDVGICDVSTLGKIDVQGRDAGTFLDRVYANTFSTLPVGKARYGLMLREDGFVLDDGTTARLNDDHYFMTTTTVNAVKVMQHLEFCQQCLWPELDVETVSVTEQWAQFAIAGPRAREVLQRIVDPDHDISNAAFPYLAVGEVSVCGGTQARLFRLSFSGELAYEIAVPARLGDALVRALMEAGSTLGIAPYGTEALGVLRIEKGHPAGGELNGQTTAHDLGMGKMLSTKKDFIGRFMAARPALTDPKRATLVGLKPVEAEGRLRAGGHLLPQGCRGHVPRTIRVTSPRSPSRPRSVTGSDLGCSSAGLSAWERSCAPTTRCAAATPSPRCVRPCFIDPEGGRLRV